MSAEFKPLAILKSSTLRGKFIPVVTALAILVVIAMVYWPVHRAGFVWIDKICFQNNAWLRVGDSWRQLIFHDFYGWINYFRPLVVALFVFEVRVFDVAPGPMHLASLGIHLANALLVGSLALKLSTEQKTPIRPVLFSGFAMLFYGLHPALIEPVAWISCQFEQVVTLFILFGLLLNATIHHSIFRAFSVALCFFLAACAKESAVSFPLLLLVFDWVRADSDRADCTWPSRARMLLRRQWLVYLGVLISGVAYLILRQWALGFLAQPNGSEPLLSFARLQTICFTYLTYLRILVWPMIGLGPLHEIDLQRFAAFNATSTAIDVAALTILLSGFYSAWKRKPIGCIVTCVTVALLPVLHIVPIAFDNSLYHERYAMTAVAMMCVLLPGAVAYIQPSVQRLRHFSILASLLAATWLGLAVMNIRVTLPLWSDEINLWQWVLREHPESTTAKDHLLSTYLERHDHWQAHKFADALMADEHPCGNCMLNVANLALSEGNVALASTALEKAEQGRLLRNQPQLQQGFIVATGQLRELQHDPKGAEEAYRDAITMDPLNSQAQMNLALFFARQGRSSEARKQAELALSLVAPDEREEEHKLFEQTLTHSLPDSR